MSSQDNPYEILQVSSKAEPEVIEAAYRRLARKYHPDVDPSPTATARMQKINWAYEILKDPLERARFDRRTSSYTSQRQSTYRPPPRPKEPAQPQQEQRESTQAEEKPSDEKGSTPTPSPREPQPLRSVIYGAIILALYYLVSSFFSSGFLGNQPTLALIVFFFAFGGSVLLSVAATAGWDPKRITFWRVLLMLVLTIFPIVAWIPSYLVGKAIARRTSLTSVAQGSRIPLIVFGLGSTLLAMYTFGEVFDPPEAGEELDHYQRYYDSEIGISFEHPAFLMPQSETTRERTDIGTIFTITVISAESTNPTAYFVVRVLEDPTRNEMFPELYPPEDDSLKLLAIGDIADFQFTEEELPQSDVIKVYDNARIITIDGYSAAEYELRPRDTMIGDAIIRGAFIVTEKWDVSMILIVSTEAGVDGSLSVDEVENIWIRLKSTLSL